MATETDKADQISDPLRETPAVNGKHDVMTHRIVVLSLGLTVLATGLNITLLEALGREPSQALTNLGSVAIGALAMCLASIMRSH